MSARFSGAAEEGPGACGGRKEPPPGGASRLSGSGRGRRAARPDFLSWAPPRHPSPGWVLAGEGARAQGLRSGQTPSSVFPGLRRIKRTGSPTPLPSPAPGAPPGEQKRVATSGTMAALSLRLLAVPGLGQPRIWALGLSSAFGPRLGADRAAADAGCGVRLTVRVDVAQLVVHVEEATKAARAAAGRPVASEHELVKLQVRRRAGPIK